MTVKIQYRLTIVFLLIGWLSVRAQEEIDLDSLPGFMAGVNKLKYNDPDSALVLFDLGLNRSIALGSLKYERNSYAGMGITNGIRGDYAAAMTYFDKAMEVSIRAGESSWIAGDHSNKGIIYKYLGDYDKSLDEYFKALTLCASIADSTGMSKTYTNLGILYDVTGELDRSLEYYMKAKALDDARGMYDLSLLSNMGILKQRMGDYDGSLALLFAFLDSMTVAGKLASIASTHTNIGTTYTEMGELDLAESHSRKSLEIATELKSPRGQTEACLNLARIYEIRGMLPETLKWRKDQLAYARATNSLEEISIAEGDLARAYQAVGEYAAAYDHLLKHTTLRDSLFLSEKNNAYQQWQTRLDVFSKDQEIKARDLELELLNTRVHAAARLRLALAIALGLALLSGILFYQRARIRRKANELLTEKNTKIEAQKQEIEQINRELEKRMLRAQINPHFIFNSLNSIQHFITADEKLSALKYLSKFSKLLRQSLENSVSVNVPLAEEIQLLETYLELESLRFDHGFSYRILTDEEIDIHETEVPILLVQPFVENAVLHAFQYEGSGKDQSKDLTIHFSEDEDHIVCTIRDNGIGRQAARKIKDENMSHRPSRGISVTEQRLAILYPKDSHTNAVQIIDLTDSTGQPCGTEVIVKIPKE